jgi:hypothetical protein
MERDEIIQNKVSKRQKIIKNAVLSYFSKSDIPCCVNCGYEDIRALCLDHVNGDGGAHRKGLKNNKKGYNLYNFLYRNNFKCDYALQTLCFNCNQVKIFTDKEGCYTRTQEWKDKISKSLKNIKKPTGSKSSRAVKVNQYSQEGYLIKTWNCIKDAERFYNPNTNSKNIVAACNGRQHTAYGYTWIHTIKDNK